MNTMEKTFEKKLPWDLFIDKTNYRNTISIKNTGYLKLESAIVNYKGKAPEKLIIYAPSPREYQNNKNNPLWDLALTSKEYGREMLMKLCSNFHDYRIVYKPFKDELPEIVKSITHGLEKYSNFEMCDVGSNYWELYSRSLIMISDFSSTAYTFAMGVSRPVIFFSPNEDFLPAKIKEGVYCKNRQRVGIVCKSDQKVVEAVSQINNNYNYYISEINKFSEDLGHNYENASDIAAEAILEAIKEKFN
jgi:CDP-glycerol glycerophosphotransferase (TagB/SpsB family)